MMATLVGGQAMDAEPVPERHNFDFGTGRKSVYKVRATVPREQRDRYFSQMRRFAKANNLKIRIAPFDPMPRITFISLWREDVMLTGGNVFDPNEFIIPFYIDPKKGGTPEVATALGESMKEFISQVPDITIKQRK
jgi:hypothetical protein